VAHIPATGGRGAGPPRFTAFEALQPGALPASGVKLLQPERFTGTAAGPTPLKFQLKISGARRVLRDRGGPQRPRKFPTAKHEQINLAGPQLPRPPALIPIVCVGETEGPSEKPSENEAA